MRTTSLLQRLSQLVLLTLVVISAPSVVRSAADVPSTDDVQGEKQTVLYLPLDERYTTRDAFLNLGKVVSSFDILTPPPSDISLHKAPANLAAIDSWVDTHAKSASAFVVSLEMYVYGGLIQSRISNSSQAEVDARLEKLAKLTVQHPQLKIYVSAVVMRIPSYNGDFEEPWYWADYGADLFQYSFHESRSIVLHNATDHKVAEEYAALVPSSALQKFVWRRQRNQNVLLKLVQMFNQSTITAPEHYPFANVYITLDDNAQYGFNIDESQVLRSKVTALIDHAGLPNGTIRIYPGADEVGLTLLAKLVSDQQSETRFVVLGSVHFRMSHLS